LYQGTAFSRAAIRAHQELGLQPLMERIWRVQGLKPDLLLFLFGTTEQVAEKVFLRVISDEKPVASD
jgi:hypothetical protein